MTTADLQRPRHGVWRMVAAALTSTTCAVLGLLASAALAQAADSTPWLKVAVNPVRTGGTLQLEGRCPPLRVVEGEESPLYPLSAVELWVDSERFPNSWTAVTPEDHSSLSWSTALPLPSDPGAFGHIPPGVHEVEAMCVYRVFEERYQRLPGGSAQVTVLGSGLGDPPVTAPPVITATAVEAGAAAATPTFTG